MLKPDLGKIFLVSLDSYVPRVSRLSTRSKFDNVVFIVNDVVVNVVVVIVVDFVFVVALNVAQDETRKGLFRSLCFCCASLVGRRRCRRKQRRSERPTPTSTTPTLTATIFQVALFASVRFWLSKNNPNQWKSEPKSKMQMKEKVLNQTSSKKKTPSKSRCLWKFSERKKP